MVVDLEVAQVVDLVEVKVVVMAVEMVVAILRYTQMQ
jgi:hypothetical protein